MSPLADGDGVSSARPDRTQELSPAHGLGTSDPLGHGGRPSSVWLDVVEPGSDGVCGRVERTRLHGHESGQLRDQTRAHECNETPVKPEDDSAMSAWCQHGGGSASTKLLVDLSCHCRQPRLELGRPVMTRVEPILGGPSGSNEGASPLESTSSPIGRLFDATVLLPRGPSTEPGSSAPSCTTSVAMSSRSRRLWSSRAMRWTERSRSSARPSATPRGGPFLTTRSRPMPDGDRRSGD
jgi:hypothetical protein